MVNSGGGDNGRTAFLGPCAGYEQVTTSFCVLCLIPCAPSASHQLGKEVEVR